MRPPEYIVHGTNKEKTAEKIEKKGFVGEEGRAQVSVDLIHAFEYATEVRNGSRGNVQKETENIESVQAQEGDLEEAMGRIVIMKVPEDKIVSYSIHTGVEANRVTKEVRGYPLKYKSGRRQLSIYSSSNLVEKRKWFEQARGELDETKNKLQNYFDKNNIGIDLNMVKNTKDMTDAWKVLLDSIKKLSILDQIEIIRQTEAYEKQIKEKQKEARPEVKIGKENVLMSIVPTNELGKVLKDFESAIFALVENPKSFKKIEFEQIIEAISKNIEGNPKNFIIPELNVREVVRHLIGTTLEAEVMRMIRSLSLKVKEANGFTIYNRDSDEISGNNIDKNQLKKKLELIQVIVNKKNFDIGLENLNRYLRFNVEKLLLELK